MADLGAVGRPVPAPAYLLGRVISGTVRDAAGVPARRRLALYHRGTLNLINKAISDATLGAYRLFCHVSDGDVPYLVVCLDDEASPDYNDLILGRVTGS